MSLCLGLINLTAKLLDKSRKCLVTRKELRRLLGVFKRIGDVAGLAAEINERQQGVPIVRMPYQRFLQNGHRVAAAAY